MKIRLGGLYALEQITREPGSWRPTPSTLKRDPNPVIGMERSEDGAFLVRKGFDPRMECYHPGGAALVTEPGTPPSRRSRPKLIGSVLLLGLLNAFNSRIQENPDVRADVKAQISKATEKGIPIVTTDRANQAPARRGADGRRRHDGHRRIRRRTAQRPEDVDAHRRVPGSALVLVHPAPTRKARRSRLVRGLPRQWKSPPPGSEYCGHHYEDAGRRRGEDQPGPDRAVAVHLRRHGAACGGLTSALLHARILALI